MTTQLIAIEQESPYFRLTTELDGISYSLSFRWNGRAGQWVLDLGDGDGNVIKAGIRCVLGVPLLYQYQGQPGVPAGFLVFVDTTNANRDMEYADLGRRVVLTYVPAADMAAAIAAVSS